MRFTDTLDMVNYQKSEIRKNTKHCSGMGFKTVEL